MGIIDSAMQPPAAPAAPQVGAPAAPAQPTGQPGAPKADPAMVQRVVLAASKIIRDPKAAPALIEQMKSIGDPVQALAQVVMQIMKHIFEASGKKIPPEVLGEAGVEVLQLLAKLAQSAGLFQVTMDIVKQAAQAAMDLVKQQTAQGATPDASAPAAPAAPATPPADPAAQPVTA